jgi:hypothetical protein
MTSESDVSHIEVRQFWGASSQQLRHIFVKSRFRVGNRPLTAKSQAGCCFRFDAVIESGPPRVPVCLFSLCGPESVNRPNRFRGAY